MEWADLEADPATLAMVKVKVRPLAVFYRNGSIRTVRRAHQALLALGGIPDRCARTPFAGFGKLGCSGLVDLTTDRHILPGYVLVYIRGFSRILCIHGSTLLHFIHRAAKTGQIAFDHLWFLCEFMSVGAFHIL